MNDLEFNRVSKRYLVREEEVQIAAGSNKLLSKLKSLRKSNKEFWAVRDVSFQVARGEALGIIGHNGAGKSTMLKLIAGITAPTSGEIKINGRLAALIEVGSGFHPELTGRENIYLSGTILGMSRREITRKLDSIIDFAGVREFIETPVKRYSSGMYVRLGFAIAAHLNPDVLLLDEVLAVGDAAFQTKCFERINRMREEGKTIVFISHDLHAVERLCNRAILMERGQIVAMGAPRDVIRNYSGRGEYSDQSATLVFNNPMPESDARFRVERVEVLDHNGDVKKSLQTGDYARFRITWHATEAVECGGVELGFETLEGISLVRCSTRPLKTTDVRFDVGRNTIELEIERFPFAAGDYSLMVGLTIPMQEWLARQHSFGTLTVRSGDYFGSGFPFDAESAALIIEHKWLVPADSDDGQISGIDEANYHRLQATSV